MKFYFQGRQDGRPIDGHEEGASEEEVRRQLESQGIEVDFLEAVAPEEHIIGEEKVLFPRQSPNRIVLIGIDWPFSSMLIFLIKWTAASLIATLLFLPAIWFILAVLQAM